jgi:ABC-type bacteriocin/lantibiotic exporter with double-glycine peptidase domain
VNSWEQHTLSLERTKAWMMSLSGLLSIIPTLLLIFIGGNMVIHGELTIGYLYIFLNLSGNVSGVLMNMPGHIAAFRQFLTNLKRMESLVNIGQFDRQRGYHKEEQNGTLSRGRREQ